MMRSEARIWLSVVVPPAALRSTVEESTEMRRTLAPDSRSISMSPVLVLAAPTMPVTSTVAPWLPVAAVAAVPAEVVGDAAALVACGVAAVVGAAVFDPPLQAVTAAAMQITSKARVTRIGKKRS